MSTLVHFEVKRFGPARVIGKTVKHSTIPGQHNPIPDLWKAMMADGSLCLLSQLPDLYANADDTVGWMGDYNPATQEFVYIAGVLAKPGVKAPEGFVYKDLGECDMGIGWIKGTHDDGDLYAEAHHHVKRAMEPAGYEYDSEAGNYELEYYSAERFVKPMGRGEKLLILDYYSPCRKIADAVETEAQ